GDLENAKQDYLSALTDDPNNATAHNNLGFLLAQEGDWDEAIRHYNQALRIDPGKSMAMANMALAYVAQGNDEAGIEWLRNAVEADSTNLLAWENLSRLFLKLNRFGDAEAAARMTSNLSPHEARFYLVLGLSVAGQQRLTEAAEILHRAV